MAKWIMIKFREETIYFRDLKSIQRLNLCLSYNKYIFGLNKLSLIVLFCALVW